jgi:hypothetical protein
MEFPVLVKWLRAAVQIQGTHRTPHASFENHKTIPENNVLLPAFLACLVFLFCSLNAQINETLTLTLIGTNSSSACLTSQISPLFSLVSTNLTVASYQEQGSDSENELLHTRDTVDNQEFRHRSRAKNESPRPKNHTQKRGKNKRFGSVKTERSLRSLPAIATRTENGRTTDFSCEQRACNGTKRRVFVLLLFAAMSQSWTDFEDTKSFHSLGWNTVRCCC